MKQTQPRRLAGDGSGRRLRAFSYTVVEDATNTCAGVRTALTSSHIW